MVQTRKLCKVAMRLSSRAPVRDLKSLVFNGLHESPPNTRIFRRSAAFLGEIAGGQEQVSTNRV